MRGLTDIVVKAHQSACKLPLVLHDDVDGRADTSVHQLEGEDRTCHGAESTLAMQRSESFGVGVDVGAVLEKSREGLMCRLVLL